MISIVTLNWNTSDLMINLLNSVMKYTYNTPFQVVIVDNGSTHQEYTKLASFVSELKKQWIHVERLRENIGFAAGNNVAMERVLGTNVIFINSDIEISEKDWDNKFIHMLGKKDVGVVGCAYHPLKWSRDAKFQIQPRTHEPVESETVQGAFFGVKNNILYRLKKETGCYFDEQFRFAHYEETDMQLRIMKMGFKVMWMPLEHIHHHNQSATKKNGFKLCEEIQSERDFKINSERNRMRLLQKHQDWFNTK